MKIGIIGAGALGSLVAWYLSGHAEVWLLSGWTAQINAINTGGLRLERDGSAALAYPRATSDPAAIGPCDAVLVLVKAHQTARATEQAQALLRPPNPQPPTPNSHPLVITLQNGIGNREILAAQLGDDRVGQGVTALGATLLGPGRVCHAGQGLTSFGSAPDRASMQALVDLFNDCGLPAELRDDLHALIWQKLLVNVGINALTALLRVPNGALLSNPQSRAVMAQAVAEAEAVAVARGITLAGDQLARVLDVAQATAANRSSMLQDVLRGSPTEISTINGAVVRAGQRLGIPTPVNQLLVSLVQALDETAAAHVERTA